MSNGPLGREGEREPRSAPFPPAWILSAALCRQSPLPTPALPLGAAREPRAVSSPAPPAP